METMSDAVPDAEAFARALRESRADRFAAALAEAPEGLAGAAAAEARRLATLTRAVRASYVLLVGGGPSPLDPAAAPDARAAEQIAAALAAYRVLHIAGAFGHTGLIEAVERAPGVAEGVRRAAARHALAERVRVHAGDPPAVVRALNGPYDLIVLGGRWREYERMEEDLTRLLRIGGSLTVVNAAALAQAPAGEEADALRRFLARLAADERYLFSAGPAFASVLAARLR